MAYHISSGVISTGITLEKYDYMDITSGGVANSTTVYSGGSMRISSGGVANSTTVNSWGQLYISSGGVANSTTVNYVGLMYICSGGVANSTTVNSRGQLYISSGGVANSTTVYSGGSMRISSGGTATDIKAASGAELHITVAPNTYIQGSYAGSAFEMKDAKISGYTMNSNGSMRICSGGVANSTTVNWGWLWISSGGVANSTTVNNSLGHLFISSGGVANSTTVYSGGTMDITSGGVANSTTVYSGGSMDITSGGVANSTTVNSWGYLYISRGGVANSTTVNGRGYLYITSGGVANITTMNDGNLSISSGGVANSTTVNSGYLYISSGGVANITTVNEDGWLSIDSGGKHTGSLDIASGGVVSALAGAIIDFDISNRTKESNALINNLSLIQGTPEYTITVAAQQADGIYKLAKGASAFSGSVTVYADGTSLGSLSIGQSFTVNDVTYKLNLQNDLLLLSLGQDSNSNPNVNDKGFAYGGNCGSTLKDDVKMLVDDGSYKRFYGGNYVEKSKSFVDIAGSIDLTVNGGTFSSVFAGGDHVVDGIVERTGSITVVINGGTFANNVAGGMCLDIAADNFGQVNAIANDINLTITGGTFAKRVFGGNISAKVAQSGHADVKGNINLTIDATASDITFSENIAAGSSGYSWVHGNVTVTLKKSASYTLDMQGLLSGGGEGAVYVSSSDGSRSATSYVAGERTLVLDSYVGEFAGTLFMFENLEVKNNTAIEFTNEKINLRDITSWDIEYGSSLDGIARNNFTGDTLDFDLTGWNNTEDWIVMSGSENAFDTIAEAENVILGGQTAQWNGSVWASADYTLTIEENNQKLVLAKVNA